MRVSISILSFLGLLTLAPLAHAAPGAAAASPDSAPPRLTKDAVPTLQELELTLDPDRADYRGRTRITLDVRRQVRELRFHTRALTIDSLVLRGPSREVRVAAVERLVPDQTRVRLANPIIAGRYTLEIAFHNDYNTRSIALYQVKTGGRSYLFTQFEDTEAREAFPCFDEPEFKHPWEMTLTVPAAHLAVGNTPVARETKVGAMRRVEFARSKPLPSYLIAIAVGPLETVPIRGMSIPGRVVTVKGASAMAAEAVKLTPPLLAALERYFGRPYPYEKLDLIAAPEFLYGAMENAGAIVFADRRLLLNPRSTSPDQRRAMASVLAHELAHMWFGDLVTMRWWDDLWLNESFASWMATKMMDEVVPEYGDGITTLYAVQRAFAIDSRLSTRAMRAKITGATSLGETASDLTYNKGEAVLTMFEGWLGAETFRRGVVDYLNEHAWKNAEAADLWRALGKVSGEDVTAAMATFLERPGVPVVAVEPLASGKVRLTQRRFVTVGEAPKGAGFWRVPVILRYASGGEPRVQRVWLTRADTTVALGAATTWIHPNAGASGYYRWSLPAKALDALLAARAELTARERIDLIANLGALLRAGQLAGDRYLEALVVLADDPSPQVVRAVFDGLNESRVAFETPSTSAAYAQFVRETLAPPLARFGMRPSVRESVSVALIRPAMLRLLGVAGQDERVLAFADSLGKVYRAHPSAVPASLVETGVVLGAVRGDRALFDRYKRQFETTTVPIERVLYLQGLGMFRDPALRAAALDYAIEGPLRPHERLMIPGATAVNALGSERGGTAYPDATSEWMLENFDKLRATMPPNFATRLIGLGGGCSEERLATLKAFLDDPDHKVQGGEATLRRLSDAMVECAKLSERERERVERWLQNRMRRP